MLYGDKLKNGDVLKIDDCLYCIIHVKKRVKSVYKDIFYRAKLYKLEDLNDKEVMRADTIQIDIPSEGIEGEIVPNCNFKVKSVQSYKIELL